MLHRLHGGPHVGVPGLRAGTGSDEAGRRRASALLDTQAEAELANCGLVAWAWRYLFFFWAMVDLLL